MPDLGEFPLRLDMQKLMREITVTAIVTVRKTREYKIRYWFGVRLLRLATWVLGCGFEMEEAK